MKKYIIDQLKDDAEFKALKTDDLMLLQGGGLSHDHIFLGDTDWLLRVPRANQLGMSSEEYLLLQKECYERVSVSGHAPSIKQLIPPSGSLKNGALVIQKIEGHRPRLPEDWGAMAKALASIHKEALPAITDPLEKAAAPFGSQKFLIFDVFKSSLDKVSLHEDSMNLINEELQALAAFFNNVAKNTNIPLALIGGDSHPGNFMIDKHGKAWLLDIEFATYDTPLIDLADAALPITACLDPDITPCRDKKGRTAFYDAWSKAVGGNSKEMLSKYMPWAERIVQMRTLLWLVDWTVQGRIKNAALATDQAISNWDSMADHYLKPEVLKRLFLKTPPQGPVTNYQSPGPA